MSFTPGDRHEVGQERVVTDQHDTPGRDVVEPEKEPVESAEKFEYQVLASDLGPVDQEVSSEQEIGDGRDQQHRRLDCQELAVVGCQRERADLADRGRGRRHRHDSQDGTTDQADRVGADECRDRRPGPARAHQSQRADVDTDHRQQADSTDELDDRYPAERVGKGQQWHREQQEAEHRDQAAEQLLEENREGTETGHQ